MKSVYILFLGICLLVNCTNNKSKSSLKEGVQSARIADLNIEKNKLHRDSSNVIPNAIKCLIKDSLTDLEIPNIGMFIKEWKDYSQSDFPYLCRSDFNGDGIIDYSLILKNKKFNQVSIYVFVSNKKKYTTFEIDKLDCFENKIGIVLLVERKGEWESITEKKVIKNDGITVELINDGLTFSYYWEKGKFEKFMYD